jgi:hypothetical protein
MKRIVENLDSQLNRMFNLMESELGNIKPILESDMPMDSTDVDMPSMNNDDDVLPATYQGEIAEADAQTPPGSAATGGGQDIDRLKQLIKSDVLPSMNAKTVGDGAWSKFEQTTVDKIKNNNPTNPLSRITSGDEFIWVELGGKQYMLTAKPGTKPNTFSAVKYELLNGVPNWTAVNFNAVNVFERLKSTTERKETMNFEQQLRVSNLISDPGVSETGYSLSVQRPDGTEGVDYIPVDLATGMGNVNGQNVQIIKTLALDKLTPEFKVPGKFIVWARVGSKVRSLDIPEFVETMLKTMGYTKTMPTDINLQRGATTLEKICSRTGACTEEVLQYATTNPNAKVYPTDLKRAQTAASSIDLGSYKQGQKDTEKAVGGGKEACRAQAMALGACARDYNKWSQAGRLEMAHSACETTLNNLGSAIQGQNYLEKLDNIKTNIIGCSDMKLGGLFGGKYQEAMDTVLGLGKTHVMSPYFTGDQAKKKVEDEKKGAMMEHSIRNSIKRVFNESYKKQDPIKSLVKKNLKRFL